MSEIRKRKTGNYIVPFALSFGHYDLAGIRLNTLVI